jgi:hypothetical protein
MIEEKTKLSVKQALKKLKKADQIVQNITDKERVLLQKFASELDSSVTGSGKKSKLSRLKSCLDEVKSKKTLAKKEYRQAKKIFKIAGQQNNNQKEQRFSDDIHRDKAREKAVKAFLSSWDKEYNANKKKQTNTNQH